MARARTAVTNAVSDLDQDFLDDAADMGETRLDRYHVFENYYEGEQNARLTDRARRFLEQSGFCFAENFCEPVIDVMADRLHVVGFQNTSLDEGSTDDISTLLGEWWERSRLDATQGVVHTETLKKGDGFLIVDFDAEADRPRWSWNRPDQIKPAYSDEHPDRLERASKRWDTTQRHPTLNAAGKPIVRLNVYYPDRVEKFFRLHSNDGAGGWQRWTDVDFTLDGREVAAQTWPTLWVDPLTGLPLGIPVFHFRNKSLGRSMGRSELRGVLPFQDELNKQVVDLNIVLDNHGFPQQWATGVTGDNVVLKRVIGDVWQTSAAEARFGQFEIGDPSGVLAAIEGTLSRMARRSRTPLHLLTGGTPPSGESLKTSESGLVAKVKDRQTPFGNAWEDAMLFGLRLAVAFATDKPTVPDDVVLQTQWSDPEPRNEKDHLDAMAVKHDLGVSKATILVELGYDPVEEAAKRAAEAEEGAAAMDAFVNRGGNETPTVNAAGTAVA